jgi:hypothetical protein
VAENRCHEFVQEKRSTITYGDENRVSASSPSFFTTPSDKDERTTSGILQLDAQISSVV